MYMSVTDCSLKFVDLVQTFIILYEFYDTKFMTEQNNIHDFDLRQNFISFLMLFNFGEEDPKVPKVGW